MKLTIKGAYYYNREEETVLMPHFTGEFSIVDCTQFEKMNYLKDNYAENWIQENKDYFIEFEGEKYYYAEFAPHSVGDWELLSDLSDLEHIEENYDF